MKRLVFVALVCGLAAVPSLGAPSLGFWQEGDPGTVHLFWNFAANNVLEVIPGTSFDVDPSDAAAFPSGGIRTPLGAVIVIGTDVTYDGAAGTFSSPNPMDIHLKMNNFDAQNPFKEIWVDVTGTGTVRPTAAMATDHGVVSFTYELLSGPGPGTGADFGWRIRPNPFFEEVVFSVDPVPGGVATLDSIHVDTICIPAPGALLLASLGAAAVGWLRTRRGL